jgi:hypothetical protein
MIEFNGYLLRVGLSPGGTVEEFPLNLEKIKSN